MEKMITKTILLFLFVFLLPTTIQAQTDEELDNEITDTRIAIFDKLRKLARGGDRNGKTLNYWSLVSDVPNNNALFEFTYLGDEQGSVYENDYRFRIDMSRVKSVKMGKSNGGDVGFGFFKGSEQSLQRYAKNHDWTVGDVKYREDSWEDSVMLFMPHDEEILQLFKNYIDLTTKDRKKHPEKYGKLPDPDYNNNANYEKQLTAEEQAKGDAGIAVAGFLGFIFGNFQEISGTASFTNPVTYEPGNYDYDPTKAYELNEVRGTFVHGENNFTFNLGFGLSWMSLPSYKRYNAAGLEIDYTDFGTVQFLSPAVGLAYKFISKPNKENFYRDFEFPLTLTFAPLFSPKSGEVKINNDIFDTEFTNYFSGLSYNVHASIGANIFFGKGIGIGVSVGGTYVNIKATTEKITETINNKQSSFTIKMDDLSQIIPRVEVKLIFRT